MKTKQVPKAAYFNPESSELGNTAGWSGRGGGCDPSKPGETCSNPQKTWEPRWEPHQLCSFNLFNAGPVDFVPLPNQPVAWDRAKGCVEGWQDLGYDYLHQTNF